MATIANTHKADQTVKADYEILIELKEDSQNGYEVVPHIPNPLEFGRTVQYTSDDGTGQYAGRVEIEFPNGSPYLNRDGSEKTKVTSTDPPLTLEVRGNFMGLCYITYKGVRYGWGLTTPNAGGNHDVQ